MTLCRVHHRFVHEGAFTLEQPSPGAFLFRRPDGQPVQAPTTVIDVGTESVEQFNRERGLDIGPDTSVPSWDGDVFDYDLAVLGLLERDGLLGEASTTTAV